MTLQFKSIFSNLKIILTIDILGPFIFSGDQRKSPFILIKSPGLRQKSFVLKGFGLMTGNSRSDNGDIDTIDHSEITGTGVVITKMKLKSPTQKKLPIELNIYRDFLSKHLFLSNFLIIRKAIFSHV